MADSDAHPEDLKEAGNTALRAGNLEEAARCYTAALAAPGGSDKQSHVYYNNRAIVRLRQKRAADAIADAAAAIEASRSYAKAYATKCAAERELGRFADMQATAALGLERCPGDAKLMEYSTLRPEASPRPTAPTSAASSAASPPAAAPASGFGSRTPTPSTAPASAGFVARAVTSATAAGVRLLPMLRLAILACTLLYLIPLGRISSTAYNVLMISAFVAHLTLVFSNSGPFSFSGEFARAAFECVWTPLVFTPILLLGARPSFVFIIPAAAPDLLAAGDELYKRTRTSLPPVASLLERLAALGLPRLLSRPAAEVAALPVQTKWREANLAVLQLAATVEVGVAIMMLVELLLPTRSLLVTLLMWQTLQMKFTLSPYTRTAFATIHARITSLTSHPACPGIIKKGYETASRWLRSQAQSPEDVERMAREREREAAAGGASGSGGGGLGGMMSRCIVQ